MWQPCSPMESSETWRNAAKVTRAQAGKLSSFSTVRELAASPWPSRWVLGALRCMAWSRVVMGRRVGSPSSLLGGTPSQSRYAGVRKHTPGQVPRSTIRAPITSSCKNARWRILSRSSKRSSRKRHQAKPSPLPLLAPRVTRTLQNLRQNGSCRSSAVLAGLAENGYSPPGRQHKGLGTIQARFSARQRSV